MQTKACPTIHWGGWGQITKATFLPLSHVVSPHYLSRRSSLLSHVPVHPAPKPKRVRQADLAEFYTLHPKRGTARHRANPVYQPRSITRPTCADSLTRMTPCLPCLDFSSASATARPAYELCAHPSQRVAPHIYKSAR